MWGLKMSLTKLLGNKSRVLVLGAALTACGDSYNNYVMGEIKDDTNSLGPFTCDDIYQRYVLECNANGNDDWYKLGSNTYECEKENWSKRFPDWTQCIFEVPCEDINDICDPLFGQKGH